MIIIGDRFQLDLEFFFSGGKLIVCFCKLHNIFDLYIFEIVLIVKLSQKTDYLFRNIHQQQSRRSLPEQRAHNKFICQLPVHPMVPNHYVATNGKQSGAASDSTSQPSYGPPLRGRISHDLTLDKSATLSLPNTHTLGATDQDIDRCHPRQQSRLFVF